MFVKLISPLEMGTWFGLFSGLAEHAETKKMLNRELLRCILMDTPTIPPKQSGEQRIWEQYLRTSSPQVEIFRLSPGIEPGNGKADNTRDSEPGNQRRQRWVYHSTGLNVYLSEHAETTIHMMEVSRGRIC